MDQLIFVAILGALALGKWLLERAGNPEDDSVSRRPDADQGVDTPDHRQAIPRRADSEEERMRRFMEALGIPAGEAPPPPPPARSAERQAQPSTPSPRPEPSPGRRIRPQKNPMGGGNPWDFKPQPVRPKRPSQPAPPVESRPVFTAPQPEPLLEPLPESLPPSFAASTVLASSPEISSMETVAPQMEITPLASVGKTSDVQPGVSTLLPKLRNRNALREALVLREILGPPKALAPH